MKDWEECRHIITGLKGGGIWAVLSPEENL